MSSLPGRSSPEEKDDMNLWRQALIAALALGALGVLSVLSVVRLAGAQERAPAKAPPRPPRLRPPPLRSRGSTR